MAAHLFFHAVVATAPPRATTRASVPHDRWERWYTRSPSPLQALDSHRSTHVNNQRHIIITLLNKFGGNINIFNMVNKGTAFLAGPTSVCICAARTQFSDCKSMRATQFAVLFAPAMRIAISAAGCTCCCFVARACPAEPRTAPNVASRRAQDAPSTALGLPAQRTRSQSACTMPRAMPPFPTLMPPGQRPAQAAETKLRPLRPPSMRTQSETQPELDLTPHCHHSDTTQSSPCIARNNIATGHGGSIVSRKCDVTLELVM